MEPYIVYEIIALIVSEERWQAKHPQRLYELRLKRRLWIIKVPKQVNATVIHDWLTLKNWKMVLLIFNEGATNPVVWGGVFFFLS